MTGRWIIASDRGLTRAAAFVLRQESFELRDGRHAWQVEPEHALHSFVPGCIEVAGIAGALHFVPFRSRGEC
ncbi:MAG: hypothetical protein ACLGI3_04495 [Actinomycetes bacterium]